ncbi:MAG TPA: DUF6754 domain-containing protein [Kofleriaceae bacterium]
MQFVFPSDAWGDTAGWSVSARPAANDNGRHLEVTWTRPADAVGLVLRRTLRSGESASSTVEVEAAGSTLSPTFLHPVPTWWMPPVGVDAATTTLPPGTALGVWTVLAAADGEQPYVDEVPPGGRYLYVVVPATAGSAPHTYAGFAPEAPAIGASPRGALFDSKRWFHLALIALVAASLFGFTYLARRKELFIRRIPGVDAIEDAVGRSTEMGRPILYVTGVEKVEDIQTIAGVLILGHVAEIAATYDTELRVANAFPLTMVIAEQVVRQGYANAGRADAHRPENVMFITSEQFAFAAAVNGMMIREQPATNIFFGRFYAESLMLAETGFLTGAVQIAGTAELTQLPFFIAACDYTLIGEELFACSAYLTREPNQIAMLKAGDVLKIVIAIIVVLFSVLATAQAMGASPPIAIEDLLP